MEQLSKRDSILRAALELIAANGFNGAPTALIAKKAEVAEGTIYRYFESKDILIQEVFEDSDNRLKAYIAEGYCADIPIKDRFFYLAKRFVQFLSADTLDNMFLTQFANSPHGSSMRKRRYSAGNINNPIFYDLFTQGVNHKIIKNFPHIMLFDLTFRALIAFVRNQKEGFIDLDEQLVDSVISACWDAVKL